MSFDDEKIKFLADIGLTPESIPDEESFFVMAEHPYLQNTLESVILQELQGLGYKWKEDAVFPYDDEGFVHAMHEFLSRRYRGIEGTFKDEMLKAFSEVNARQAPGEYADPAAFLAAVFERHYEDIAESAHWVSQHPYAKGKANDPDTNEDAYGTVADSIGSARQIAKTLRLHRKSAKPTDLEINLEEALRKGWVVITEAEDKTHDLGDAKAQKESPEKELAEDEEDATPPPRCKGLTKKLLASFLKDLGITRKTIDDDALYDAILQDDYEAESTLMVIVEATIRACNQGELLDRALDFHDPKTIKAMHDLLRTPFDGFELMHDDKIREFTVDARMEAEDEIQETETPELTDIANNILENAVNFHAASLDKLLQSVQSDKPRSTICDDPLHDLAIAQRIYDAIQCLGEQYGLETQESPRLPLGTILTRAAEHGLVQPDRKRGPHKDDASLVRSLS